MRGLLNLSDGFHECISARDSDICPGIGGRELAELFEVCLDEFAFDVAHVQFEERLAGGRLGQGDVNATLESPTDHRVQNPRDVRSAQNLTHSLHL